MISIIIVTILLIINLLKKDELQGHVN